MSSPMMISNLVTNSDRSRESKKKRRKKNQILNQTTRDQQSQNQNQNKNKWKTEAEQQIYSSKLVEALRHIRLNSPSSSSSSSSAASSNDVPKRGRAVREAADRALAVTAKGRTRWSRAILTSRLKLKFMKQKRKRSVTPTTGNSRLKSKQRVSIVKLKAKNLPAVQRKVKVLGRLVPGCRKQSMPVILEETSDYIAALQMQVRAMTALTQLLSGNHARGSI